MDISALLSNIRADKEVGKLLLSLSSALLSRNTAPMRLMQFYSGEAIEGDKLTQDYSKALELVKPYVEEVNFTDMSSIKGLREYQALNNSIWFVREANGGTIDVARLTPYIVAILLEQMAPRIDEYVKAVSNTDLHQDLALDHDSNYLVDISSDRFDLKKHGLIVDSHTLVYPHQFMRRYYSANFVDLLSILAFCKSKEMVVKIRLDPLRGYCDPRFYQNIMEADHWHGEPFAEGLLMSKDKKETLTFHISYGDQTLASYPVKYTIFRSSMMDSDKGLRQFIVEEYTPSELDNAAIINKAPGFGANYCIQKFAHFVYDQNKKQFTHIDGATRTFTLEEYMEIESKVSKGMDPGSKIGTRDKLFLVEGEIERKLMFDLLYEFFRYNPHLEEYYVKSADASLEAL